MSEARTAPRAVRLAAVMTHHRPEETAEAVQLLIDAARSAGAELQFDDEEAAKHDLAGVSSGSGGDDAGRPQPDICFVLGGDGATLRALRAYTGTDVPVFAINFGRIGFLATVDRAGLEEGLDRAFGGAFEVAELPAMTVAGKSQSAFAINEVSLQRRSHLNVTHLSYSLSDEEIVRAVPCDGLIAATPVGSTGYNLSVGGPIVAWGVHGFAVSLIAPHALSYRPLVAAPDDELRVTNEGAEPVDVVVDGIHTGEIGAGESVSITYRPRAVGLAQLPGSSFYGRFREKLLRLTR
ncbi:MAG: NAD(+)/NADH kinase [Solirubrobacterales bacterium]